MSWAAIVGQPLAVRLLRRALSSGKAAHAYLFVGPDGVGKRTVALEMAKALNCLSPSPDGDACETCSSCRKLSATPVSHPDVALISPEGRFIKTDQMRELQADMYARPTEGKVRVAILDGADRMNAEAGNRVLKLLEEPPAHAKFVLLTHNLAGVLPTIVSRCQIVHFPPLSPDAVVKVLQQQGDLDSARAHLHASLSGGSIGRAMQMAQDQAFHQRRDEIGDFLQNLDQQDDFALLGLAETLEKQKDQLDDWLELLTLWLRDALLVAQTGSEKLVINTDRLKVVRVIAQAYGPAGMLDMLGAVTETRSLLQRNVNTRLALDVLLLRLGNASRAQLVQL